MSQLTVVLAMKDTHAERYGDGPRPASIGTLPVWRMLGDRLKAAGHRFVRMDDYDPSTQRGPVVVLWDFGSFARLPRMFRSERVVGIVAWSLESPLVAHRAYHRLDDIAKEADAVFAFPGARDLIAPERRRKFEPLYWPSHRRGVVEGPPWKERKLLVMVNSNKRANTWWDGVDLRHPYQSARRLAASALAATYRLRGEWTVPDLYEERLRAIEQLAEHPGFDLYGTGWDQPVPAQGRAFRRKLESCYRGPVQDKVARLSRYRFALVIENTVFPGYVTEKLFDPMLAGTIPVYRGAPDVDRYVPPGSYLDASPTEGYEDLVARLEAMSESDVSALRRSVRQVAHRTAAEPGLVRDLVTRLEALVEMADVA